MVWPEYHSNEQRDGLEYAGVAFTRGALAPIAQMSISNLVRGGRVMSIREEHRKKALECLIAAEGMADPAKRLFLLEIAQKWIRMAARLESLEPSNLLALAHRPDRDTT
jgi:hypothetical protein